MKTAVTSLFVVSAFMAIPAPARAASPQAAMSADHNLDERIEKQLSASTLKKWEQGQRFPTGAARTLMKIIEREPQAVLRALKAG